MSPTRHSWMIWTLLAVTLTAGIGMGLASRQPAGEGEPAMPAPAATAYVRVRGLNPDGTLGPLWHLPKVVRTETEWQKILTPEQFRIMRRQGTEAAFCGLFHDNHAEGLYVCVGCGLPLFASASKFDSGTGWPSFWEPVASGNIAALRDTSHGMVRTEIRCVRCDAHLGHVFDDGPKPSGKRHCLNSESLRFLAPGETAALDTDGRLTVCKAVAGRWETATFAAGCFWGVEETFRTIPGVVDTQVGYTGGSVANPTYEQVCTHRTGHAEAVEVLFAPDKVSYDALLTAFWECHDPTTPNRQGPDVGSNYRSAIFTHDEVQAAAATASRDALTESGRLGRAIVTEIVAAGPFYRAEEYHQKYALRTGHGACHVPTQD